jgi:hypothetical protein
MKIEAAVARQRGRAGAKRQMTPFDTAEYRRKDRARERAAAKALAEAGAAGDAGKFFHALGSLRDGTLNGWTLAMREIARLGHVSEEIQTAFALIWASDRHPLCHDPHAFLDAMRVLFPPYRGPVIWLFRLRRSRSLTALMLRPGRCRIG